MKPVVIVLGIEYAENLGMIARAMKNFSAHELILVQPTVSVSSGAAKSRAMHAGDVLKNAHIVASLEHALEYVDYSIATTAQTGSRKKMFRTLVFPPLLAERFASAPGKLGIVLGRESSGLTNTEIRQCDFIVHIPASREYPTLNISHACAILLYALFSARKKKGFKIASRDSKKLLGKKISTLVAHAQRIDNKHSVLSAGKALISRSLITEKEAKALLALFNELGQKE